METGNFDHSNEIAWPTPRLLARLQAISIHLDTVKLTQDRIKQLDLEANCITYEVSCRGIGGSALTLFEPDEY